MTEQNFKFGALFDLDGVLIDSETEYTRIWELINRQFPTGVPDFEHKIKGTTLENILDTYFRPEVHKEVMAELYRLEGKMKYPFCPGAERLLTDLRADGIPIAIVTSSNKQKMAHLWELQPQLKNLVDAIVDGDQVTRSKPDPEGYLTGAHLIDRDPRCCVVFEDSLQGVRAGKAAGAFVVGLSGTLGRKALEGECDILVDSLEEICINDLKLRIYEHATSIG